MISATDVTLQCFNFNRFEHVYCATLLALVSQRAESMLKTFKFNKQEIGTKGLIFVLKKKKQIQD